MRSDETHRLDPEARFDRLDLRAQEPEKMGNVAGRPGRSNCDILLHAVDPRAQEDDGARGEPRLFEHANELRHQLGQSPFDCFGSGNRLGKAKRSTGRIPGHDRIEGFGRPAERLIKALEERSSKAALERAARHCQKVADAIDAEAACGAQHVFLDAERSDREPSDRLGFAAGGAERDRMCRAARQRMSRARRSSDSDAGGKSEARAKTNDPRAHPLLAAKEVHDTGQIEPEPVRAGGGRDRRPAPSGKQSEAGEKSGVGFRIGVAQFKARHHRPRLRYRRSGLKSEALGNRASRGNDDPLARTMGCDNGCRRSTRVERSSGANDSSSSSPERDLSRLGPAPQFAYLRPLMDGKRVDFGLSLFPRPARARPPAAPARARAGVGSLARFHLCLRRASGGRSCRHKRASARGGFTPPAALDPPQAVDGKVRQVERGDPSHLRPPR